MISRSTYWEIKNVSEETKKYVQQHKYMTKVARKGERDTLHIISDIKKKGLNEV